MFTRISLSEFTILGDERILNHVNHAFHLSQTTRFNRHLRIHMLNLAALPSL